MNHCKDFFLFVTKKSEIFAWNSLIFLITLNQLHTIKLSVFTSVCMFVSLMMW